MVAKPVIVSTANAGKGMINDYRTVQHKKLSKK